MGLRQVPNRRLSAAPSVRFAATQRHRTRKHSNDKRAPVIHILDDGRSSGAGVPGFAIVLKCSADCPPQGNSIAILRPRRSGYSSDFSRARRLRSRLRRRGFLLRAGGRSRPASLPAARLRISRPSGCCREPCWISLWSATIGRRDMPCHEFHPRVRLRKTPPGACRTTEIPHFPADSPNPLTVPFMKGSHPHKPDASFAFRDIPTPNVVSEPTRLSD